MRTKDEVINNKKITLQKQIVMCHRCRNEFLLETNIDISHYKCENCKEALKMLDDAYLDKLNNMNKEELIKLVLELEEQNEG